MKTASDWTHEMNLHHYTVTQLIKLVQEEANDEVIDSIIIDLTKRGFFINPSKMKSQMIDVIRSHKQNKK